MEKSVGLLDVLSPILNFVGGRSWFQSCKTADGVVHVYTNTKDIPPYDLAQVPEKVGGMEIKLIYRNLDRRIKSIATGR